MAAPTDDATALADHAAVLAAASSVAADRPELLAALRRLVALKRHLDTAERRLIEASRDRGASWAQLADALGLASRQAAEQRWLRLSGGRTRDPGPVRRARRSQRSVDLAYGEAIVDLRAAVTAVHRLLARDPDWDERHPRARLARATLALAVAADPRAVFALAVQAGADLGAVPPERLPAWVAAPLDRLRRAIATATPPSARPTPGHLESD
ncbi:hypothetical protein EF879_08955 [Micromonospora sp. HM5-17]|nr:hypothetical protein EF879_08955 [Micromonospora sp. HM5-17]